MKFLFPVLLAGSLSLAASAARAESCEEAITEVDRGFRALKAAEEGRRMALEICERLSRQGNMDAVSKERCQQWRTISFEQKTRSEKTEKAIEQFSQAFEIPRGQFLRSLNDGSIRELMAQQGDLPEEALARLPSRASRALASAPKEKSASEERATASTAPTISAAEISEAAAKYASIRDKMRKAAGSRRTERGERLSAELAELTPLSRAELMGTEKIEEERGLTLFEVIHLRYRSISPRLRP